MQNMQKAIIYKGPGKFAYEERPIPKIQHEDDVKIKIYGDLRHGCQHFCHPAKTSM